MKAPCTAAGACNSGIARARRTMSPISPIAKSWVARSLEFRSCCAALNRTTSDASPAACTSARPRPAGEHDRARELARQSDGGLLSRQAGLNDVQRPIREHPGGRFLRQAAPEAFLLLFRQLFLEIVLHGLHFRHGRPSCVYTTRMVHTIAWGSNTVWCEKRRDHRYLHSCTTRRSSDPKAV